MLHKISFDPRVDAADTNSRSVIHSSFETPLETSQGLSADARRIIAACSGQVFVSGANPPNSAGEKPEASR